MLKYLFIAEFLDGSKYSQNQEDISVLNPLKSCYFDVLDGLKTQPLKKFSLVGDGKTYSVDLINGHFEYEGETIIPKSDLFDFNLIYFRRKVVLFNAEGETPPVFHFGWEATDSQNQKVRKILEIS